MTEPRFTHLPDAPMCADKLLGWFIRLGLDDDAVTVAQQCATAAAQLSQCELSQLYWRDEASGRLELIAQHLPGAALPGRGFSGADFQHEQLLHFVISHNRALSLDDVATSVYEREFLPVTDLPWHSLVCVPLISRHMTIAGVLLCASQRLRPLQGWESSLAQLGSFALNQWALIRRSCSVPLSAPAKCDGSITRKKIGLVGNSAAMDATYRLIEKVKNTTYTVLLRGETGTGKEVVARAIHFSGPRSDKAFVVQNCAAFPEGLLESELFGYRKGAFTGAERHHAGLFDAAHGGTLLLDEIGDMPLSLQAKLLRVLQEGEVRPLGASAAHKVDVRIIAATHRDLSAMVAQGLFREDLYYRLAQFPIELPALRERDGDVLLLARDFARQACATLNRGDVEWSSAALDQLSSYGFPGNVRELKCLVERAVLLCDDSVILPAHLSLSPEPDAIEVDATLRQRLERVERIFLIDCLHKNRGNRTRTARELGVSRRTLLYRLARLKIPAGNAREEG